MNSMYRAMVAAATIPMRQNVSASITAATERWSRSTKRTGSMCCPPRWSVNCGGRCKPSMPSPASAPSS